MALSKKKPIYYKVTYIVGFSHFDHEDGADEPFNLSTIGQRLIGGKNPVVASVHLSRGYRRISKEEAAEYHDGGNMSPFGEEGGV